MIPRLLLLAFVLCGNLWVHAANPLYLTNAEYSTVQTAHNNASAGDIIVMPAGQWHWTNVLFITNSIKLFGVSSNLSGGTVIYDEVPTGQNPARNQGLIVIFGTASNIFYRLSNFAILDGSNRTNTYLAGWIQWRGQSRAIRTDHIFMQHLRNTAMYVYEGAAGVFDHIWTRHLNGTNGHGIFVDHSNWKGDSQGFGDQSWADPTALGTTNMVVVETSDHDWITAGGSAKSQSYCDAQQGGRLAIRYNNLRNSHLTVHGAEIGGNRVRGCRMWEFYMNNITTPSASQNNIWEIRSGTGVIWSNITTAAQTWCQLEAYRIKGNLPEFWGPAYGTNGWDKNIGYPLGPVPFATHNGASSSATLVDTLQSWTNNALVGFSVYNTNADPAHCYAMIMANTATTCTFDPFAPTSFKFNPGDVIYLGKLTNGLDVTGNGQSDLNTDSTPKWLNFALECIYGWENTHAGSTNNALFDPKVPFMLAGSWYSNNTAHPTYTPLVYPHPLVATLTVTPASGTIAPGGTADFDASDGSGSYYYYLFVNNSGGSINTSTGVYTAGATSGVVDTIHIWDLSTGELVERMMTTTSPPSSSDSIPFLVPLKRRI